MHAGLAVAISVALIMALRDHRVLRVVAGGWGPLMCVDVVATGNHFLFDIATGLVLTAAGFGVSVLMSNHARRKSPRAAGTSVRGPDILTLSTHAHKGTSA